MAATRPAEGGLADRDHPRAPLRLQDRRARLGPRGDITMPTAATSSAAAPSTAASSASISIPPIISVNNPAHGADPLPLPPAPVANPVRAQAGRRFPGLDMAGPDPLGRLGLVALEWAGAPIPCGLDALAASSSSSTPPGGSSASAGSSSAACCGGSARA